MYDMDKIDFAAASVINPSILNSQKPGTKKAGSRADVRQSRKTLFDRLLEDAAPEAGELGALREMPPSEEALTELMDAVHSAGSDLIDRPFADEILNYKKAVRNFVHYVVQNTYVVEKTEVRRRGKTIMNIQIQVIDKKLEELAAAILSGQTRQLDRIAKVDEIKGLLVDLNLTITGVIRERDE